jgi:ADP-ribosylglycohydrolase
MALCLAESLLYRDGFDPTDQMNRYVNWWQHGYLSSTGECFDIGGTTAAALARYLQTGNPYAGSTDAHSAGNGSLMRLAPVALFYFPDADLTRRYAAESSRTTHAAAEAVECCEVLALALHAILNGEEAVLTAVNLGDDADTTGAITGQLAGAYYGISGLPHRWIERLAMHDHIDDTARRLMRQQHENQ